MTHSEVAPCDRLYDSAGVRQLDALAIKSGSSGFELMQRAGRFAFERLCRRWPSARRIVVFCGHGNNGGDGYIIARLAFEQRMDVTLVATGPAKTQTAREAARRCPIQPIAEDGIDDKQFDVIVDAILGNGLTCAPRDKARFLIETINRLRETSAAGVMAIDVPSGLNSTSGDAAGVCVRADETCTFIGMKLGLLTGRGPALSGQVSFFDCGVPRSVYGQQPIFASRITPTTAMARSIHRDADAHKGTAGRVLVVGGNRGYAGAVRLSGEAALRTGAGLVVLATHPDHYPHVVMGRHELMCHAIDKNNPLQRALAATDVVAVGPGLGVDDWAQQQLQAVMDAGCALVLDADALNLLARNPCARQKMVITPHPGEAARLLGTDTASIQADRPASAKALHERYGAVVILKGAGTLVVGQDGDLSVCNRGHAGMASAGMGDVLTGVVVSLLAQGADLEQAAKLGVWLHAVAAEDAGVDGTIGMVASDLMQPLRRRRSSLIDRI